MLRFLQSVLKLPNRTIKYLFQMDTPQIQNVVSLAKLNYNELDLHVIAQKSQNSRYNPKRFPAVITRKISPKSTILIFKSGKLIIIGARSESDAKKSADISAADISKWLNKKYKVEDFKVTNIVANAYIGFKVDIAELAGDRLSFKDDTFPGVIYKMNSPVKAVLIFNSGKLVFTGAKDKEDINQAFAILKEKLQDYRIHN